MCKSRLSSLVSHFYQPYTELCSISPCRCRRAGPGWVSAPSRQTGQLYFTRVHPINASLTQNDLDETTLTKTCSSEFMSETQPEGRRERPDLSRGCHCSSAKFASSDHMQITEQYYSRVISGCSDLMKNNIRNLF